ncbi:hypothetical protein GW17_00004238 [Ensete ventricosum]|nr:hypothetical protein GW17_00004238 [Ensete ventricosum]
MPPSPCRNEATPRLSLRDEATPPLPMQERGNASSPRSSCKNEAPPHLPVGGRGTASSPSGRTRHRLISQWEDEAARLPAGEARENEAPPLLPTRENDAPPLLPERENDVPPILPTRENEASPRSLAASFSHEARRRFLHKVCNFDIYRPVWAVHTDPPSCRYADRPLPGGSTKNQLSAVDFDRRRSIEGEIDRRRLIEREKGKKKKKRKKKKTKEKRRKRILIARAQSSPVRCRRPLIAGAFSPARGERSRRLPQELAEERQMEVLVQSGFLVQSDA